MADIVIRGMEMPEFCDECGCKRRTQRGACCGILGKPLKTSRNYKRDDECPLVPLPEGHGRLGDLDALSKEFEHCASLDWNQKAAPYSWAYAYSEAQAAVDDSPTIVPAEGGGEDER